MPYSLLADLILALHLAFILFVAGGGLLVIRWPRLVWLHLPAVVWGVLVELKGWYCPLTPWEQHFRILAGEAVYSGDFIGRTLLAVIYPDGLTRNIQIGIGVTAILANLLIYAWMLHRRRRIPRNDAPDG